MNIRLKAVGVTLAFTATVALTAVASAQDGYASRVDLHYKDADLYSATHLLTLRTGTKFVIASTDKEFKSITLSIDNVTPDDAIRYICEAAGAYWELDENGVYIIRQGVPPEVKEELLVVEEPRMVQLIKLMKADARVVYMQITNPLAFDFRSLIDIRNRAAAAEFRASSRIPTAPLIIVTPGGNSQVINPMASTAPTSTGIVLPGEERASQIGGGGFGGGQGGGFGGGQGGGGFGGGGFGGGGQGGQFGGGLGDVGDMVSGTGLMPDGIDSVQYDPTDNSLIVRGTAEGIRELERIIALFDKAPEQVIIKVEFITTSTSLDRSLGIDWFYQRGSVFAGSRPGTFARASDPIFINYSTGNIQTRLRTLLTHGWGRTVTSPMLRTMNNQPATVFNSVQTTIFINQVINGPSGVIITPNPISITATTFLSITPRINGDRTITMNLQPQISGFGQLKRGPDGQEIPDILTQFISVVARVKNGETIALGGMTNKVDNYSESRIPILSDLPIIGQLFRGRNTTTTSSELIIFVTPTIVEDDNFGLGP